MTDNLFDDVSQAMADFAMSAREAEEAMIRFATNVSPASHHGLLVALVCDRPVALVLTEAGWTGSWRS